MESTENEIIENDLIMFIQFYFAIAKENLENLFDEKIGYSYLDFNGNFLWADEYSKEVLFEEKDITKINLFEIMSKFSKYVLKKKYGDKFFDFKDENNRIRVFTYTIEKKFESKEKILDNFFEVLNSNKTLVSRASAVLLQNYGDNGTNPCILLETKYSILRQNYDYFLWKKYIN